jgi:hypothetical protein
MTEIIVRPSVRTRANRGIGWGLLVGLFFSSLASPAMSGTEGIGEVRALKAYWQGRYRNLVARAEELRGTIAQERELYADANRRNFRRGRKRHIHRQAMKEAVSELTQVDAELAGLEEEGRRSGALPGWFYEVEMELEDAERRPAISAGPGDEGRNPLHSVALEEDR